MAEEVAEVATRDIQKELGYQKWMFKITERLMIVCDCIKSRVDIKQEDDWAIIEMLHKNWFFGEHILYETITVPDLTKSVTQASLFDDKTSVSTTQTPDGIVIEPPKEETKKTKKK